jgi:hypothetical protein
MILLSGREQGRTTDGYLHKAVRQPDLGNILRGSLTEIDGFGAADGMEADIRLLERTRNMHWLFEKQQAAEKRRLLNFVVSNSVWKGGEIVPVWRHPFDMIAVANQGPNAGIAVTGPKTA